MGGRILIWAVVDCPYTLNIEGFGRAAPTPTPNVGAVYDCTISNWAVTDRPYNRLSLHAHY